jgi:hypothetical protein
MIAVVLSVMRLRKRWNYEQGSNEKRGEGEEESLTLHDVLHVDRASNARAGARLAPERWRISDRRTARSTTSRLTPNTRKKIPKSEFFGAALAVRR